MKISNRNMRSRDVIRHLKQSKSNYAQHYFQGGSCYDDEGNDCGMFSEKIYQTLLTKSIIILVGASNEFWSNGYYKLNDAPW